MADAITLGKLRRLSASAIQALPHALPIKNGGETIGLLLPLRRRTTEEIAAVSAKMDAMEAERTPEDQAVFDAALERWERV